MSYEIFLLESHTKKIGLIKPNGEVYSIAGERMGRILGSGEVRNARGYSLGRVNQSGILHSDTIDVTNYKIGRDGTIMHIGEVIGAVKQKEIGIPEVHARWGAFALFYDSFAQEDESLNEIDSWDERPQIAEPVAPSQAMTETMEVDFEPIIPDRSPNETPAKAPVESPIKTLAEVPIEAPAEIERQAVMTQEPPDVESLELYAQMRIEAFMKKKKREQASALE